MDIYLLAHALLLHSLHNMRIKRKRRDLYRPGARYFPLLLSMWTRATRRVLREYRSALPAGMASSQNSCQMHFSSPQRERGYSGCNVRARFSRAVSHTAVRQREGRTREIKLRFVIARKPLLLEGRMNVSSCLAERARKVLREGTRAYVCTYARTCARMNYIL